MEGMEEIVQEFLVESHENLDQLDQDLLALERDPNSRELLSSIFRTLHTIKGTSGFLALHTLERVAHAGESLLSKLRDGEIIAAAHVHTIKKHGPDRVFGFSPIPAMSMVSYAAGSRYLSLLGGVCMSFYDWYCDLPPASPQTWGEQTDVPESADWYNSTYIIAWGSNVPQTRTPDAHFFTEVRYKGAKTVAVTPDYSEVAKLADL